MKRLSKKCLAVCLMLLLGSLVIAQQPDLPPGGESGSTGPCLSFVGAQYIGNCRCRSGWQLSATEANSSGCIASYICNIEESGKIAVVEYNSATGQYATDCIN